MSGSPRICRAPRLFCAAAALVCIFAASPAAALSRLTLFVGPLVPFGDFSDLADLSWTAGVRTEFQGVDEAGVRSRFAFFAEGTYSGVFLDDDLEAEIDDLGLDDSMKDSSLLGAAVGARWYSRSAPFFASAGVGYLRYEPPFDGNEQDALDLQIGLGFLWPLESVQLEALAVLHEMVFQGDGFQMPLSADDFQFLTATLGFVIPF